LSADQTYYNGLFNNFILWTEALTEEEIQDIIYQEPTVNEDGLAAYYKFNAGTGNTLYDHSGNGNHGTINGAQWDDGNDNIHRVPHEYESIQVAINASSDGDTVLVSAGTYYENLEITKFIHLIGENKQNTIIDANQNGRVININSSEIGDIKNFTITNGFVDNDSNGKSGAGIYVFGVSGSYNFRDLNIINNIAKDEGGGIIFRGGRPNIINCNITNNTAARGSGLFFTEGSLPNINGCTFSNNTIVEWYHSPDVPFVGNGGGIAIIYVDYSFNEGEFAQIINY
jgi:hypothetical protein